MADTFELEIATPERSIVKERAVRAQIPGKDGYMGILPDHAPLLSQLGIGTLSYVTPQGSKYAVAIHGGYVEVLDNQVRVLADVAEAGQDIDAERARRALDRAKQAMEKGEDINPAEGSDPASALAAVMRAEARLEAARKVKAGEE
jgi:F-type H+-transporting ATPase subunit epsilon